MTLAEWLSNGWLTRHTVEASEVEQLLNLAERDIQVAGLAGLTPDWVFNIAYNAVIQAATAALAASGYRASRDEHHYRILQSLKHTIGADSVLLSQLDKCRKKRNMSTYELAGIISEHEAIQMVETARQLTERIRVWILKEHPTLAPRARV